jgi:hypothetical protein
MSALNLSSSEIVWVAIAIIALPIILIGLRLILNLAMSLIRIILIAGVLLILLYISVNLFLR